MKIRLGFVSNSSSSSFVVVYKKYEGCKCCGQVRPNLLDLVESDKNYENEVHAADQETVLLYLQERIDEERDYDPRSSLVEELEEAMADIKSLHLSETEKGIAVLEISYHNIEAMALIETDDVDVFWRTG